MAEDRTQHLTSACQHIPQFLELGKAITRPTTADGQACSRSRWCLRSTRATTVGLSQTTATPPTIRRTAALITDQITRVDITTITITRHTVGIRDTSCLATESRIPRLFKCNHFSISQSRVKPRTGLTRFNEYAIVRFCSFRSVDVPAVLAFGLRILMLLALAAHAAFGCCLHHQHQSHDGCGLPGASKSLLASPDLSSSVCCSHDHDDEDTGHDDTPQPCRDSDDCNEPSCSYVTAKTVSFCDLHLSIVSLDSILSHDTVSLSTASRLAGAELQGRAVFDSPDDHCVTQSSWQL